jgi:tetratricopeptide (TPR) repeat protein
MTQDSTAPELSQRNDAVRVDRVATSVSDFERALVRRLSLVFVLPLVIAAIATVMFFVLNARLKDVEIGTKLVNVERVLLKDQNYAWAVDQYEKIAKDSKSAAIQSRLAYLLFTLDPGKNEQRALTILELSKRLDPAYSATYTWLAYIHVVRGRAADAIREGRRALDLNEFDAATYNNLAWLHATSSDPQVHDLRLARTYSEKALALTKRRQANYLDTRAEVAYREGDRAQALQYLRKAMTLADPEDLQNLKDHLKTLFPNEGQ